MLVFDIFFVKSKSASSDFIYTVDYHKGIWIDVVYYSVEFIEFTI